jgi:hypothetical protein
MYGRRPARVSLTFENGFATGTRRPRLQGAGQVAAAEPAGRLGVVVKRKRIALVVLAIGFIASRV